MKATKENMELLQAKVVCEMLSEYNCGFCSYVDDCQNQEKDSGKNICDEIINKAKNKIKQLS